MKNILLIFGLIASLGLYAQTDSTTISDMTPAASVVGSNVFETETAVASFSVTKHILQKTLRDTIVALEVVVGNNTTAIGLNTTHRGLTNDPHSVTAAQVGLGSVENTALSTWPGTANLTTLGTIGTGLWQGTAIADGFVANNITLTNITQITTRPATSLTGTNWRVFYVNGSGAVTELALGANGTFLKSNGASSAPTFAVPAGSGDVSKVGTPVDNQVGVWTGDGTLEGTSNFTYDGSNFQLTGDIGSTGTRITKGWFTDLQVTNAIAGDITGNAATVTSFTPAGGSLTLSGADALTITTTAATNVTFPTSGTLVNSGVTDLLAPIASPTFTGTVTMPTPFTLGATSVTSTGVQLNYLNAATGTTGTASTNLVFSTSPTLITPALGTPSALVGTNISGTGASFTAGTVTGLTLAGGSLTLAGADALTLTTTAATNVTLPTSGTLLTENEAPVLLDTFTMSFLIGVGNAGDTIGFTLNNTIAGFDVNGSHDYIIREFAAVLDGTTPDIDLMLQYDVNWNDGTPTDVLSGDLTVTSTTTGNSTTTFSNATIPKGSYGYVTVEQATVQPVQCLVTISYSLVE